MHVVGDTTEGLIAFRDHSRNKMSINHTFPWSQMCSQFVFFCGCSNKT